MTGIDGGSEAGRLRELARLEGPEGEDEEAAASRESEAAAGGPTGFQPSGGSGQAFHASALEHAVNARLEGTTSISHDTTERSEAQQGLLDAARAGSAEAAQQLRELAQPLNSHNDPDAARLLVQIVEAFRDAAHLSDPPEGIREHLGYIAREKYGAEGYLAKEALVGLELSSGAQPNFRSEGFSPPDGLPRESWYSPDRLGPRLAGYLSGRLESPGGGFDGAPPGRMATLMHHYAHFATDPAAQRWSEIDEVLAEHRQAIEGILQPGSPGFEERLAEMLDALERWGPELGQHRMELAGSLTGALIDHARHPQADDNALLDLARRLDGLVLRPAREASGGAAAEQAETAMREVREALLRHDAPSLGQTGAYLLSSVTPVLEGADLDRIDSLDDEPARLLALSRVVIAAGQAENDDLLQQARTLLLPALRDSSVAMGEADRNALALYAAESGDTDVQKAFAARAPSPSLPERLRHGPFFQWQMPPEDIRAEVATKHLGNYLRNELPPRIVENNRFPPGHRFHRYEVSYAWPEGMSTAERLSEQARLQHLLDYRDLMQARSHPDVRWDNEETLNQIEANLLAPPESSTADESWEALMEVLSEADLEGRRVVASRLATTLSSEEVRELAAELDAHVRSPEYRTRLLSLAPEERMGVLQEDLDNLWVAVRAVRHGGGEAPDPTDAVEQVREDILAEIFLQEQAGELAAAARANPDDEELLASMTASLGALRDLELLPELGLEQDDLRRLRAALEDPAATASQVLNLYGRLPLDSWGSPSAQAEALSQGLVQGLGIDPARAQSVSRALTGPIRGVLLGAALHRLAADPASADLRDVLRVSSDAGTAGGAAIGLGAAGAQALGATRLAGALRATGRVLGPAGVAVTSILDAFSARDAFERGDNWSGVAAGARSIGGGVAAVGAFSPAAPILVPIGAALILVGAATEWLFGWSEGERRDNAHREHAREALRSLQGRRPWEFE